MNSDGDFQLCFYLERQCTWYCLTSYCHWACFPYLPFTGLFKAVHRQKKKIALGPLFVPAREDRGSGKAENAYIHHKQNSRMGKV